MSWRNPITIRAARERVRGRGGRMEPHPDSTPSRRLYVVQLPGLAEVVLGHRQARYVLHTATLCPYLEASRQIRAEQEDIAS